MYEWTYTGKSPNIKTSLKFDNLRFRNNFTSNGDKDIENPDVSIYEQTLETSDIKFLQNRLNVAKTKLNECQMDASSFNILTEVFKDLEMICSELLAVRKKLLSQNDLLNETENDLYVSCVNETMQLQNLTQFDGEESYNGELTSANSTATLENIDNVTAEDNKQNICDKIEICKNCGKENMYHQEVNEIKTPVDQLEKWTQTESSSIKPNEHEQLKTTGTINTPVNSSTTTSKITNCENVQSVPIPPPMPPSFSSASTSSSTTVPPPPPMPPAVSHMPPAPPPMPNAAQSLPPAPPMMMTQLHPPPIPSGPPMPPPMPGNISDSTTKTTQPSLPLSTPPFGPPPPPFPGLKSDVSVDTVDAVSSPSSNGLNGLVGPSSSKVPLPTPLPMPAVGNVWFQANSKFILCIALAY